MATIESNIKVFKDTINWIKTNRSLSKSVENSIQNTQVYFEKDLINFKNPSDKTGDIEIIKKKTFEAAIGLCKQFPDKKIAVMNFANAFVPGGGVKNGAFAQEECLCRCSTLYPVISSNVAKPYYQYHKKLGNDLASNSLIYSEDIIICKTDTDYPERMPEEQWVKTDVITVAAPDLNIVSWFNDGMSIGKEELYKIHVERAEQILRVAACKGAQILVLGAFGCGAFRNDPYVVAEAYKDVLNDYACMFDKIEFAIYSRNNPNYEVFEEVFLKYD